ERALEDADLLVTIGGVSVGEHDLVRPALEAAGASLDFWKVAIRPGKPLAFGRSSRALVLGLPGNPVSAQVTFTLFGVPLLHALQGATRARTETRLARLTAPLRQRPGRRGYYRARLEGEHATPLSNQASGAVTGMAWANALVVVPADSDGYAEDELVPVIPLGER
ncbi:MAG: molybdopterin-binding protein, partial [Sorangiineae bacterium]|nr:molybdopterin-binding protein [Sorangiineae bacterium]